jgi:hypothetical protein
MSPPQALRFRQRLIGIDFAFKPGEERAPGRSRHFPTVIPGMGRVAAYFAAHCHIGRIESQCLGHKNHAPPASVRSRVQPDARE